MGNKNDEKSEKQSRKTKKDRRKHKKQKEIVNTLKHLDVFYEAPPPGLVQEEKEKPEDCIPDLPENKAARDFLANAPQKGLWMPLGKEVKVMKCWRCKQYGHRTGDKECPMFVSGNEKIEMFRATHEDPMFEFVTESKRIRKQEKIKQLQSLLEETSDSDSECGSKHKLRKRRKSEHHSDSSNTHSCSKKKKKKKHKHKHSKKTKKESKSHRV